jgi:hypothetical protein
MSQCDIRVRLLFLAQTAEAPLEGPAASRRAGDRGLTTQARPAPASLCRVSARPVRVDIISRLHGVQADFCVMLPPNDIK